MGKGRGLTELVNAVVYMANQRLKSARSLCLQEGPGWRAFSVNGVRAQHATITSRRLRAGYDFSADHLFVILNRARPADYSVHVANFSHGVQGRHQQGRAYATSALSLVYPCWTEEVQVRGIKAGKAQYLLAPMREKDRWRSRGKADISFTDPILAEVHADPFQGFVLFRRHAPSDRDAQRPLPGDYGRQLRQIV